MDKNGENANLKRVPWVQIPDAQKNPDKEFRKPSYKDIGYLIRIWGG